MLKVKALKEILEEPKEVKGLKILKFLLEEKIKECEKVLEINSTENRKSNCLFNLTQDPENKKIGKYIIEETSKRIAEISKEIEKDKKTLEKVENRLMLLRGGLVDNNNYSVPKIFSMN